MFGLLVLTKLIRCNCQSNSFSKNHNSAHCICWLWCYKCLKTWHGLYFKNAELLFLLYPRFYCANSRQTSITPRRQSCTHDIFIRYVFILINANIWSANHIAANCSSSVHLRTKTRSKRPAEVQTDYQNGDERDLSGWSAIFSHSSLWGLLWKRGTTQWATVLWVMLPKELLVDARSHQAD